jgi:hypothetical protein
VAEQADARVIGGIAAGGGLQGAAALHADARVLEVLDDPGQFGACDVRGDRIAVTGQPVRLELVHAVSRGQAVRRELHVPGGPDSRADLRLVGRLVLTEPHVAVGTEDLWLAEFARQFLCELAHRGQHMGVVHELVCSPVRL